MVLFYAAYLIHVVMQYQLQLVTHACYLLGGYTNQGAAELI